MLLVKWECRGWKSGPLLSKSLFEKSVTGSHWHSPGRLTPWLRMALSCTFAANKRGGAEAPLLGQACTNCSSNTTPCLQMSLCLRLSKHIISTFLLPAVRNMFKQVELPIMAAGLGKTNETLRAKETHPIDSWKTHPPRFGVTILKCFLPQYIHQMRGPELFRLWLARSHPQRSCRV